MLCEDKATRRMMQKLSPRRPLHQPVRKLGNAPPTTVSSSGVAEVDTGLAC